ncbi:MAG: hypothetical protein ACK4JX_10365, partial [Flavobacterium sp.]
MKKNTFPILLISFLLLIPFFILNGQNLIQNGDFQQGFNVGFQGGQSPQYNYIASPTGITNAGNWAIGTNPFPFNTVSFITSGDHTTGTGNMMIVDGTNEGGQQRFYRAGTNGSGVCGLTTGVTYTFSYWIRSIFTSAGGTLANIGLQFNNANNIQLVSGSTTAPLTANGWQQVVYTFTPTNACVNIEMFNNNTDFVGNDFAIDDISLTPPPQPLSVTFSTNSVSCFNANDGFIAVYPKGGTLPYTNYILSGPVSTSNNIGTFSNLSPGVYSVTVIDSNNNSISQNNITITQPNSIGITPNQTICSGEAVNLFVTGVSGSVTWSANPTGSGISNPNANPLNVSPAETTVFTATVNNQTNLNLITNGNFSSGNFGFYSDHNFGTPPPAGAQRLYNIVTNPNSWFAGFPACPSDPSNTNPMMVVDGSTLNNGNDAVWCQTVRVKPNQLYTFSYRIRSLVTTSPAQLQVVINGAIASPIQNAPTNNCVFEIRNLVWNSTNNEIAQICIFNRNTSSNGNDFALDDIEFFNVNNCEYSISTTVIVDTGTVETGFTYPTPVCENSPNIFPTLNNNFNTNGSFSATPSGLNLNTTNGNINVGGSNPGTYTVTYQVVADPTNCIPAGSTSFDITILPNTNPITGFSYNVPNCQTNTILNPILATNFTTGGFFSSTSGLVINSSTGEINLGASSVGSYEITYSVLPNNSNCINAGSSTFNITINSNVPTPNINILTQPNCANPNGGSFQVTTPMGAVFEYSIDGVTFQPGTTFSNLAPGTYTVTVRHNITNCINTTLVIIDSVPSTPFVVETDIQQPTCILPTGSIQITSPIGVNYEYSLNNISFQSSNVFSGLVPANYTIFVKEISTQCIASSDVLIENLPSNPPIPTFTIQQPNCITSGSITVSGPLGSNFEYSINNTDYQNSIIFQNLVPGNYTITVRDITTQCINSQSFAINNPPADPSQATATINHPTCIQSGSLTITTPLGNNLVYSIDGTNFQSSTNFTNLNSGNYTITVQNIQTFCTSNTTVLINPKPANPDNPIISNIQQPNCVTPYGAFSVSNPVGSNFSYSIDGTNFQDNPTFSNLTTNTYQVIVRDNITGCISSQTQVEILPVNYGVNPVPVTPLQVCDANNDGFAVFDLTQAGVAATAGNPDYLIAYFETFDDADFGASANQITNPSAYNSVNNANQTVYIRVTSQTTGCHVVVAVTLVANPTPEATTPSNLTQCDDNTDGIGVFNLNSVIPQVLGSIPAATHTVSFHSTEAAAIAGNPSINNTNAYSNTTPNQEIVWVRVTNNTTECFDVVPLTLVVHPNPVVNATSLSLCDANNPGD